MGERAARDKVDIEIEITSITKAIKPSSAIKTLFSPSLSPRSPLRLSYCEVTRPRNWEREREREREREMERPEIDSVLEMKALLGN